MHNESEFKNKIEEKKKKPIFIRFLYFILLIISLPFILIFSIIKLIINRKKYKLWKNTHKSGETLLKTTDITYIDIMQGYEFEFFLKTLFFYLGYQVKETPKKGDFGADLILKSENKISVVQAKRYTKSVGVKSVQEVTLARTHYKADFAIVVTNSFFTPQAEELARENSVQLIDRKELQELIKEAKSNFDDKGSIKSPNVEFEESNQFRI